MEKEFDVLEQEVLKAIFKCSAFDMITIKNVYRKCGSFDKTIAILKLSVAQGIPANCLVF